MAVAKKAVKHQSYWTGMPHYMRIALIGCVGLFAASIYNSASQDLSEPVRYPIVLVTPNPTLAPSETLPPATADISQLTVRPQQPGEQPQTLSPQGATQTQAAAVITQGPATGPVTGLVNAALMNPNQLKQFDGQ